MPRVIGLGARARPLVRLPRIQNQHFFVTSGQVKGDPKNCTMKSEPTVDRKMNQKASDY